MPVLAPLWRHFYSGWSAVRTAVLDALFPIPPEEREVLAMGAEAAFRDLPRAPRCSIPDACSIYAYGDERVSRLIWAVKYKKSREGSAIAGYALWRAARLFSLAVPAGMRILVVPMPITKQRRRERGYNQCDLILDEMRRCDAEKCLSYAPGLLVRVRHTSRQTMKDRAGRLESVKDLFAVNETAMKALQSSQETDKIMPKDFFIVVIDDVITTGSTIKDAIMTLRAAGFENTYGLSVAH